MIRVEYKSAEDLGENPASHWDSGSIFCENAWLNVVAGMGLGEVGIWQAWWEDEPVLVAPVLWRRTKFGDMAFLPPLTPYWGLVFTPKLDDTVVVQVLGELVKQCVGWRISLPPEQVLTDPPFPHRVTNHTTQVIQPKPKEQLWHDLTASCRQKIRAAQNENLTIYDIEPVELATMMAETFARKKVRFPLDKATLIKVLQAMVDASFCRIRGIQRQSGDCLAARMIVQDKRRKMSYDIAAGSSEKLRGGAGNLLLWEEMLEESAMGHALDLVGTNVSGVAEFKRSFGGVEKQYQVWEMFKNKTAEMRYRLSRRLGMLP
jgi:hypothetical protein